MNEKTPSSEQIEDLTRAITMLHPTIQALEACLRNADRSAVEREELMAQALDRIAHALEGFLEKQQQDLMRADMARNREAMAQLLGSIKVLEAELMKSADRAVEMAKLMNSLVALLRAPT